MVKKYRHKIVGLIVAVIVTASSYGQKIMDLPLYSGNPSGAFTAISLGNVTRRYDLGAFLRSVDATGMYQQKGNYITSESDPKRVTSVAISGGTTKTVALTLADGSVVSGTFTDNVSSSTELDPVWLAEKSNYYNKAQIDAAIGAGGGGTAGVSSWNGRTGIVESQLSDYSSFYAALVHQHDTTTANTGYSTKGNAQKLADLKVDKVTGKQLSTEDYTTAEKNRLVAAIISSDSTRYSTKANVTKVRDSLQANLTTGLATKKASNDSGYAKGPAAFVTTGKLQNSLDSAAAKFVRKTDTTSIYIGQYLIGSGTSASALNVDISKVYNIGTVSFTGNGSTTSFTFPVSSIPGLSPTSMVSLRATTPIGAAIDWIDVSTEGFTVYYLTAPTSGSKTLKYFIVP